MGLGYLQSTLPYHSDIPFRALRTDRLQDHRRAAHGKSLEDWEPLAGDSEKSSGFTNQLEWLLNTPIISITRHIPKIQHQLVQDCVHHGKSTENCPTEPETLAHLHIFCLSPQIFVLKCGRFATNLVGYVCTHLSEAGEMFFLKSKLIPEATIGKRVACGITSCNL